MNDTLFFRATVRRVLLWSGLPVVIWRFAGWRPPAPDRVKRKVLRRFAPASAVWIETGTYLGETTAFLGRHFPRVISIEPQASLARRAKRKFRHRDNIVVIEGSSEDVFGEVVAGVAGPISFWLDGHYSAGFTFLGEQETPIRKELAVIERELSRFTDLTVFIDDFRSFVPSADNRGAYPSRSSLVNWADRVGLSWTVENDIFVAWKTFSDSL